MWPFSRKRQADKVLAIFDEAVEFAAEKWTYFNGALVFKDDVELKDKIATFLVPFEQGAKNNFPELRNSPDTVLLLVAMKGIVKSGTHTQAQIEDQLGITLPN